MHTAAKVMLVLGVVFCVIGGGLWIAGEEVAEVDYENDSAYSGTSGTWDHDNNDLYLVYAKKGTACAGFEATMTSPNGSTSSDFYDNIELYDCEDWGDDDEDGYIVIGTVYADEKATYSMSSSSKIYIIGAGEEIGEAVGGIMAILASWGIICCGAFFLLLGGIFALTLKTGGDQVVVVQQQNPMMGTPGMTHMAAPQYQQPVQAQQPVQHEQPVQHQQPPQGGL